MSRRAGQTDPGFSLVELLVVLAIVSLLTAILLPGMSSARNQANRTRCLNNIRQIGMGIAFYVNDYDCLPAPQSAFIVNGKLPVYYNESKCGLLALRPSNGFERSYLSCPDGWASGGSSDWYESRGLSRAGAAYMDYAYWGGRYPPGKQYDVRSASFTYRAREKGTRILVTDIIVDQGDKGDKAVASTVGRSNHGSNHPGEPVTVRMTSGQGKVLDTTNRIRSIGTSVLFSDYHAVWFPVEKLTQQSEGLCYPPPDQW